jgi:hypothetical protein
MYSYIDKDGSVCITNKLEAVPAMYRASMKIVKEEDKSRKKLLLDSPQGSNASRPAGVNAQQGTYKQVVDALPDSSSSTTQRQAVSQSDNKGKYLQTALIAGIVIAGYFILGRITGSLGFPRVGTAIFILLLLVGGVYLYGLYITEMRAVFAAMRKDAINIQKNVESRGTKTDQLLQQPQERAQE